LSIEHNAGPSGGKRILVSKGFGLAAKYCGPINFIACWRRLLAAPLRCFSSRTLFRLDSSHRIIVCADLKNTDRSSNTHTVKTCSCHKRQKPQAPIRNRQTRKVANAKGLYRNTNLT